MSHHPGIAWRSTHRPGLALPAAVVALAIVSLFIVGSSYVSMQETRVSRGAIAERIALEAAEYGAAAVLRDWDPQWSRSRVGATLGPWLHPFATSGATATVRATHATATSFWVVSEGLAGPGPVQREGRRVVNALYRLDVPDPRVLAALTARDTVRITGSGHVSGTDSVLVTADDGICSATAATVAAVASPDTTRVCDGSCGGGGGRLTGVPPLVADSAAADPLRYLAASPGAWAALAARADVVLPHNAVVAPFPVSMGGVCDRTSSANWGDPSGVSACAAYFPIIWVRGDVTITGGAGQGVLLADGDVRMAAGASFAGLIVARDDLDLQAGGTVLGAVLVGDASSGSGDHTRIGDGGLVRYSACGVSRALFGSALLRRVGARWWSELF